MARQLLTAAVILCCCGGGLIVAALDLNKLYGHIHAKRNIGNVIVFSLSLIHRVPAAVPDRPDEGHVSSSTLFFLFNFRPSNDAPFVGFCRRYYIVIIVRLSYCYGYPVSVERRTRLVVRLRWKQRSPGT